MRQDLIEKIKSGTHAIYMDGTREQLNDVLKVCFPYHETTMLGDCDYYLKCDGIPPVTGRDETDLPTIPLTDFFKDKIRKKDLLKRIEALEEKVSERKCKPIHEVHLNECDDIEFILDSIDLYYGGFREDQSEIKTMIEAYAEHKVKEFNAIPKSPEPTQQDILVPDCIRIGMFNDEWGILLNNQFLYFNKNYNQWFVGIVLCDTLPKLKLVKTTIDQCKPGDIVFDGYDDSEIGVLQWYSLYLGDYNVRWWDIDGTPESKRFNPNETVYKAVEV